MNDDFWSNSFSLLWACYFCPISARMPGWAEFSYFLCYSKMVAPRALVLRPLVKGNEALGTRLTIVLLF